MKKWIIGLVVLCITGCKEKYDLPVNQPETGYLVIEGVINSGPGETNIELSRTNKITSAEKQYERNAVVEVQGEDNSSIRLPENGVGVYTASLSLDRTKKYRLSIRTQAGKEYISEYVPVKITPAIDSISWDYTNEGLQLMFNTHDPQNDTRYYQWDYQETWEFHSAYKSFLKYVLSTRPNGEPYYTVGAIDPIRYSYDSTIYACWKNASSTNILIGSSAKLSSDVISKFPFLKIPKGDRKLSVLYSIYVRQFALTKQGYEFLEKMKKNTEQTGSIFDSQPSQLKGNVTCVTAPDEPVIGFVSISTIADRRIFIRNDQVPSWNFRTDCFEARVKNASDSIDVVQGAGLIPTDILESFGPAILYFGVSTPQCVNCTLTGSNIKPAFWP